MVEITRVPCSPEHIEGVIDLRGQVVPVVSLHKLFGWPRRANLLDMYILIGDADSKPVGLTVESMSDLRDVRRDQLEEPDESHRLATLLSCVAKLDDGIVFVLDLNKIGNLGEAPDFSDTPVREEREAEQEDVSSEVHAVLRERAIALRQAVAEEDVEFKRFVTFALGNEKYATDGSRVEKVLLVPEIVPVPGTVDHFAGMMNYAGDILWVLDVKKLLGLAASLAGNDERVVVLNHHGAKFGFLADAVFDVMNVPTSAIRSALAGAERAKDDYVAEEIYWRDELIAILDLTGLCVG
jgi:purine-binding chemotaxis protein CheW